MAHHFSMRLASLALAAVTALGVSSAVPAFADTHHGASQDQRSAMRSDNDNDHHRHHRRGECREGFRESEHNRNEKNRNENNNRRDHCEVSFHHKFVHKHHHRMERHREFMMSNRH